MAAGMIRGPAPQRMAPRTTGTDTMTTPAPLVPNGSPCLVCGEPVMGDGGPVVDVHARCAKAVSDDTRTRVRLNMRAR